MKTRVLVVAVGALFLFSGCATNKKWGKGTAAGALIGGAVGGLGGAGVEFGRDKDRTEQLGRGAAVGAAVGMIVGGLVGHFVFDEAPSPPPPPPPTPQPAIAEAPPPPTPAVQEKKIVLHAVHFDFNRAQVRPQGAESLEEAAEILKENENVNVVIEGHTDAVGSDSYNMRLGFRRAEAVKGYLVEHGIDEDRLEARSLGESQPVASNETAEGRAQNRRVELKLSGG